MYKYRLEHKSWRQQLRELRLLSLERRRVSGDPYHSTQLPEKRRGSVPSPRERVTGQEQMGSSLDTRRNFFTDWLIKQWKGLSRDVVESLALKAFKE